MMAEQPDHQRLAEMFGELAFEMQSQKGSPDTLRSIVHAATHIVPGAGGAGVSLIEGKKIVSEVPSNPTIAALDELQSGLNEGPCLSALRDTTPCTSPTCAPKRAGPPSPAKHSN